MGLFDRLPSVDLPNPFDYVPDIELPSIPNPLDYVPDVDIPNPLDYLPDVDIPNPLDLLPDIDIPNPLDLAAPYVNQGGRILDSIVNGETNTAPNPAMAAEGEEMKARYQAQAYRSLGISEEQFATMDPIARNGLINAAYARMYMSDPDTFKWAGMAAMASDKAGTGMMQTYMLEAGETIPGGGTVEGALGAPDGDEVRRLLAKGNAAIFNDMLWQHLAFQSGGLEEMERAAEEGSITPDQLDGWRRLSAGQSALQDARASGDPQAIAAAQQQVWGGNRQLLFAEQMFVGEQVYDESPESREAFRFLSGGMNVLGVGSPVPGGTSFNDYREGHAGTDDVGDFDQRWGWIQSNMLPEYQAFEGDTPAMNAQMQGYLDREHKNQWMEKSVGPALPYLGGPISSPFADLF